MTGDMVTPKIVLLGTCDSKLEEVLYLRERIVERKSCSVLLVDVGRNPCQHNLIDVGSTELLDRVARPSPEGADTSLPLPRAGYIKHMTLCASLYVSELFKSGAIHGIISMGGSNGTSIAAAVMRNALPVGFPKLIVSTMASGNIRPFIEETDIAMMYSVVDIAGINSILSQILSNAAGAIIGMIPSYMTHLSKPVRTGETKRIGITMFGVTTPCVDTIRLHLESKHKYEVFVFHATGSGGKAMERLVRERKIDAVLDVTTTEVADELVGGVLSAGPDRLATAAKAGIPQVISVGACDMVNFGTLDTVPAKFNDRQLHEHNPTVTLMRTTPKECSRIGEFISKQLRVHVAKPDLVEVILPSGGVSTLSVTGGAFENHEADTSLFDAVESGLAPTGIKVVRSARDINDPEFAILLAESLVALIQRQNSL
ncbi:hypothetical protein AJ80_03408 [Polytolypa hystricis UAMH7299]|uniref:Uncharacterized protein n=1 Tax=Polytolypa hystricis (strain UAMH7299) TaxID=1447883 RepID=A0A2B7YIA5_POLH7|nr:hypothetical protein AJ80_03408 [Polytolypa hystricis UAMH7299]